MSKSQKTKLQKFVLALGIVVIVAAVAMLTMSLVYSFTSVGNGYIGKFSPKPEGDKPLLAYARFCNAIRKNLFGLADSYTPDASANSAFLLGVGCCIIGVVWLILAAVKKKFIHMLYFLASIATGFVVSFGYFLGTRDAGYHWDYLNIEPQAKWAEPIAAKSPFALVINLGAYILLVAYVAFFVLNLVSLIKIKPAKKAAEEDKKEEEKPAEEPKAEEKPEEKPAEEKPAEEKKEEPKAEEKPAPVVAEQPKAEEKKEEKPAEEPKPEEKPAEEKPAEEPKAEEKPAEEKKAKAPAKKAPAKKPAEKKEPAKKAEPKKEAKTAPEKKEEPKAEKKAPAKKPAEKKEPAKKAEPKKEAPKAEPKPAAAKAEKATPRKDAPRSYHVCQHPQGGWQVKGAGSDKALKRFPTQAEAIKWARELEKSSGVSFRVHSMKGKIRKA